MADPSCSRGKGGAGEGAEEAGEDELVEGPDGEPVGEAGEADGIEGGGLGEEGAGGLGLDVELEPGAAGEFHFGEEAELLWRGDGLDAPAVEGVANAEGGWVGAAAAHADAAEEEVDPAAEGPERVGVEPAVLAAEALDGGEEGVGRDGDVGGAGVNEAVAEALAAPLAGGMAGGGEGVGPA